MPNRLWGRGRSGQADDLDMLERETGLCLDRVGLVPPCSEEEDGAMLYVERRGAQTRRELAENNDTLSHYETVPSSPNVSISGEKKRLAVSEGNFHELDGSKASLLQDSCGPADERKLSCRKLHEPLTSAYLEDHESELLLLPLPQGRIFVKCKELQAYNIVIFTENGVDKRYNLRDIVCRIVNRQPCDKIETRIVEHWLRMVAEERHRNESISVTTNAMLALFVTVGALLCTLLASFVFQVVPAFKALLGRKP